MPDRFTVILPTAGKSSRFGAATKKPFALLAGKPVWSYSAELFARREDVVQLIIVLDPDDRVFFETHFAAELENLRKTLRVDLADGGYERIDSVRNALRFVVPEADWIAVHDTARPCVRPAEIDAVFTAAREDGAALLAVPIFGTIKRGDSRYCVEATVPRENLWEAQTPQVFRRDIFIRSYEQSIEADMRITDDCQLVERLGHPIRIVPGARTNIKITTQDDLQLAEYFLALQHPDS